MRKFKSILCTASILPIVWTMPVAANSLTITIENIEQNQGRIMLQILSGAAEFEGRAEPVAKMILRARTGRMRISTSNLPEGHYAVRVMHDINNNDELDSNIVGLPIEPYAFSNNAVGNFGPPQWKDAKFWLSGSVVQKINLIH